MDRDVVVVANGVVVVLEKNKSCINANVGCLITLCVVSNTFFKN